MAVFSAKHTLLNSCDFATIIIGLFTDAIQNCNFQLSTFFLMKSTENCPCGRRIKGREEGREEGSSSAKREERAPAGGITDYSLP